jgi:ammonia channel protein AmtB
MTFLILKAIERFVPLRVSKGEEERGLDVSQHAEVAYQL